MMAMALYCVDLLASRFEFKDLVVYKRSACQRVVFSVSHLCLCIVYLILYTIHFIPAS